MWQKYDISLKKPKTNKEINMRQYYYLNTETKKKNKQTNLHIKNKITRQNINKTYSII